MSEMTCEGMHETAAEYALGILSPEEQATAAAHLVRCPQCRNDVAEYTRLGNDLLGLIPAAEPSPGFERRVLKAARKPHRTGRRWAAVGVSIASVAAAVVVAAVLILTSSSGGSRHLKGDLVASGKTVGSVYTAGNPPYVWMAVKNIGESGPVMCQVVRSDGAVLTLGTFDLVDGSGSWATPEPADLGQIVSARLTAADGKILAQARFGS